MAHPVSSLLLSKLKSIKQASVHREEEKCDFCGKSVSKHRNMIKVSEMRFMRACEMCSFIQSVRGDYKLIPTQIKFLKDFYISEELRMEFIIPVNIAFFVFNSSRNSIVASYPAPSGAIELNLKMETWKKLETINSTIKDLKSDIEALLVNRLEMPVQYYIAPINLCYKLVEIIKTTQKGVFGGKQTEYAIQNFFRELKNKIG
jgi:hypothetical protein